MSFRSDGAGSRNFERSNGRSHTGSGKYSRRFKDLLFPMTVFKKTFLFLAAPLMGFILLPLILGLLSTAESSGGLVPVQAWILLIGAMTVSALVAFVWSRYLYPVLHHSLEESYQGRWEKGKMMAATAALISTLFLVLTYRPCIFTSDPSCRGALSSAEMLIQSFTEQGLAFTDTDQRASAVIGSFTGLVVSFTILMDELFSRVLFYWKHRNSR